MAAVLVCGPGALLAYLWAAWNYGLRRLPHGPVQVLTPRSRHARPGIEVHTGRCLTEVDYDHNHGIPTTSPARTVPDCSPTWSSRPTATTTTRPARALSQTTRNSCIWKPVACASSR